MKSYVILELWYISGRFPEVSMTQPSQASGPNHGPAAYMRWGLFMVRRHAEGLRKLLQDDTINNEY